MVKLFEKSGLSTGHNRTKSMKTKNLGGRPSIPPRDKATENVALTPRQVEAIKKTIKEDGVRWQDVVRKLVDHFIADGVSHESK